MKCETCGYEIATGPEMALYEKWGCARVQITKNMFEQKMEMCGREPSSGQFYPPYTTTPENPEAFKEEFVKKYDKPKKKENE